MRSLLHEMYVIACTINAVIPSVAENFHDKKSQSIITRFINLIDRDGNTRGKLSGEITQKLE